ncbi:carbohydrate ABC transporter permease [Scatolibacter rhodanostii]|uniref:carbohydrate ABC transporter permease n=1 Tax=Scatolibacter rhodanostii TaxID=2014781 RepID=UPI00190EC2C3|nr:carbohydrate ABC transporter permease [Scatolibacter rhodanostii]
MITNTKLSKIVPHVCLAILTLTCILPLLLLALASFTDEQTLLLNGYSFFPAKFSMAAYQYIFKAGNAILRAYSITIFITIIGTICNMAMTVLLAYPLARPGLKGRNLIAFIVFFTMLFNGGLVPTYIMYSQMFHIRDTIFALLIPSFLMSPFNVILVRNYFKTNIPDAIIEAAKLDGASEINTLVRVVLPMSTPIIGTIGLMSGLAYWNDWTNGLYYLVKRTDLYTIQNVLTNMLNNAQFLKTASQLQGVNVEMGTLPSVGIRMAIAVVALLPVVIVYPFIQKSFVKGIVVGGVKG